jgi:aminoglycoside phosphotransferase (APT) family kinase protein
VPFPRAHQSDSTTSPAHDAIILVADPLHEDEIPIDTRLVRALVDRAFPDWEALPLRRLGSSGSTNALFRLGDDLLVRLPRQPGGTATIEKEARWLPRIGPLLPVGVPDVVAVGEPGLGYTERWSIVRWLDGHTPTVVEPGRSADPPRSYLARDLAAVIRALRNIDVPPDALIDPDLRWYRGAPLATRDASTRCDLEACRRIGGLGLDFDTALRVWDEAMTLPGVQQAATPHWYHGDLAAENLLVRDGRLAAVLDFGGLAVGDPTVDLMVAWEVLDPAAREVFRRAVGADEASWLRARAWALSLALTTLPYYWRTMPVRCVSRLAAARAVLADAA